MRLAGDMREIQSGEDSDESEASEFVAEAVEEMGKRVREALATAESSAAAALTACEALGGETQKDPQVVSLFFTLERAIRLTSCFVYRVWLWRSAAMSTRPRR